MFTIHLSIVIFLPLLTGLIGAFLPRRLAGLLEAESGFNDPPVIILVTVVASLMRSSRDPFARSHAGSVRGHPTKGNLRRPGAFGRMTYATDSEDPLYIRSVTLENLAGARWRPTDSDGVQRPGVERIGTRSTRAPNPTTASCATPRATGRDRSVRMPATRRSDWRSSSSKPSARSIPAGSRPSTMSI